LTAVPRRDACPVDPAARPFHLAHTRTVLACVTCDGRSSASSRSFCWPCSELRSAVSPSNLMTMLRIFPTTTTATMMMQGTSGRSSPTMSMSSLRSPVRCSCPRHQARGWERAARSDRRRSFSARSVLDLLPSNPGLLSPLSSSRPLCSHADGWATGEVTSAHRPRFWGS
jgi:hypothetical protein